AHHLGRADLLDAHGGTDIVQVAPASLTFDRGTERIACVRLSPKGLHRWYATCCKTPVGNTLTPSIPFVGIVRQAFTGDADAILGSPRGASQGKYAIGEAPEGSVRPSLRVLGWTARCVLGWKLGRKTWP